jgi:sec-independent protein translocase protein TatB
VLRTLGQWMTKIRRMASEFQGQFQEAMREAEMTDLKKQFDDTTSSLRSTFDTTDIKNELEKMIQDPMSASSAAAPPSDPTAPAPQTPASAPTDPVALGTAPVAPPAADLSVPMPELPPPPETKDFVDASTAPASAPAPAPSDPKPAATPEGGKAA